MVPNTGERQERVKLFSISMSVVYQIDCFLLSKLFDFEFFLYLSCNNKLVTEIIN